MLDLNAGKYAAFVWPAYALSVVVIGALITDTLVRARGWRLEVEAREAAQDAVHSEVATRAAVSTSVDPAIEPQSPT